MTVMAATDFERTVAVIGAGFTGSLFALKLAQARADWTILLVEARQDCGRGLAYGACAPQHILNVPVSRMEVGLEPGFGDWLRARPGQLSEALAESGGVLADAFVPRQLFGDYIQQQLQSALVKRGAGIHRVHGEVMAVCGQPRRILLDDGRSLAADLVVLATGNPAPSPPWRASGLDGLVADPWAPGALQGIGADAPVLLIGSGLTAVDVLLSLRAQGHRGAIHMLSRHGLFPRAHKAGGNWGTVLQAGVSPLEALRIVRAHVKQGRRPRYSLAAGLRCHTARGGVGLEWLEPETEGPVSSPSAGALGCASPPDGAAGRGCG